MIAPGADLTIYIRDAADSTSAAAMMGLLRSAGDASSRSVQRRSLRVSIETSDRIKILVWDRTGLVLVHKRLEGASSLANDLGRRDAHIAGDVAALFEGLDWRLVRPEEARAPQAAG